MNWRNEKIKRLANSAPHCMACERHNEGQVVAAHSNQSRDGKGMQIKAHDFRVAYLCDKCHMEIDQGKDLTRLDRIQKWEEAHRATIEWLFLNDHLEVV